MTSISMPCRSSCGGLPRSWLMVRRGESSRKVPFAHVAGHHAQLLHGVFVEIAERMRAETFAAVGGEEAKHELLVGHFEAEHADGVARLFQASVASS